MVATYGTQHKMSLQGLALKLTVAVFAIALFATACAADEDPIVSDIGLDAGGASQPEAVAVTRALFAPDIVDVMRELGRPDAAVVNYGFAPLIDVVDVMRELGGPEASIATPVTGPLFAPDIVDVMRELGRSDAPVAYYGFVPLLDTMDVMRELGPGAVGVSHPEAATVTGPLIAPDIVDVMRELGRSDAQ